jgi:dienelactone hydrolase
MNYIKYLSNSLPKPKGPHKLATDVLRWDNVQVRVWYPTEDHHHLIQQSTNNHFRRARYASADCIQHMSQVYNFPKCLVDHYFNIEMNSITRVEGEKQMVPLKPLSPNETSTSKYPVIVFSHGLMGFPEHYSTICEHLTSQGYIVVAPYHTDGSCPVVLPYEAIFNDSSNSMEPILFDQMREEFVSKQRDLCDSDNTTLELLYREYQLRIRISDVRTCQRMLIALSENNTTETIPGHEIFANKIDRGRIGVLGHSFGGGTIAATLASTVDPQPFRCGMSLDGWLDPVINNAIRPDDSPTILDEVSQIRKEHTLPPLAFVNSDLWQWKNNLKNMDTFLHAMSDTESYPMWTQQSKVYKYKMTGTAHHNFNDISVLMPWCGRYLKYIGPSVDSFSVMDKLTKLIEQFFDYHMEVKEEVTDPLADYVFQNNSSLTVEEEQQCMNEAPTVADLIQESCSWKDKLRSNFLLKQLIR